MKHSIISYLALVVILWSAFCTGCGGSGDSSDSGSGGGPVIPTTPPGQASYAEPLVAFDQPGYWTRVDGSPADVFPEVARTGKATVLLDSGLSGGMDNVTLYGHSDPFVVQSGDQVKLWCYFPAESQSAITIYLGQGGFASYIAKTLSGKDMVGWWCFMVRKEEFSLFGSVDWQKPFDTIRIRLDSSKPHDRVHLDGLYINSHDQPQVVITFDDGSASDYSFAYKVMKEYGLVGTSFIITDFVGRNTNLSLAEMTEMYASGWDFANHTKSHKDLTLLDTPHMVEEIVSAKQWLLAHGFTRAADYFAFPYGRFGGTSDALGQAGVVAARTTINSLVETASGRPDRLRIPVALSLSPLVTRDMAHATVDEAVARGQSLVIYGHAITSGTPGAYEWQANDFRELMRYIAQKRDEGKLIVKTFREWSSGL